MKKYIKHISKNLLHVLSWTFYFVEWKVLYVIDQLISSQLLMQVFFSYLFIFLSGDSQFLWHQVAL